MQDEWMAGLRHRLCSCIRSDADPRPFPPSSPNHLYDHEAVGREGPRRQVAPGSVVFNTGLEIELEKFYQV
jgi:hypothetical protein